MTAVVADKTPALEMQIPDGAETHFVVFLDALDLRFRLQLTHIFGSSWRASVSPRFSAGGRMSYEFHEGHDKALIASLNYIEGYVFALLDARNHNFSLSFGKWKGYHIWRVDTDYLDWIVNTKQEHETVWQAANAELLRRLREAVRRP